LETQVINIFDMNNVARRYVEAGSAGGVRDVYSKVAFQPGVVFAIWDGYKSKEPRLAIYPKYKERRVLPTEDISAGLKLVYEVLKHSKAIQIKVPGFEADDVIAQLALRYAHHGVHIFSTDADFTQLLHVPGITLDRKDFKVDPSEVRLFKACVGDPSDNIPGIKGLGAKAWQALSDTDKEKLRLLAEGGTPVLDDVTLPKAALNWLSDTANVDLFRSFWKIVGFMYVPEHLINTLAVHGVPNLDAVNEVMAKYLLPPKLMSVESFVSNPRGLHVDSSHPGGQA
jgi:hypothetical protein